MAKNFLFIDDSGSKQWITPYAYQFAEKPPARTDQNRVFWQDNYFVLAGLHISDELVAKLNPMLNDAKKKYFGTKHVEIRSVNLRNPEKQKKYYIDEFGITKEQLTDFIDNHWYKVFVDHQDEIQLQAFILDKRYYKNQRATKSCLEITSLCLFDRVELHPNKDCVIVFDQMDAEIKSTNHDQGRMLKVANKEVDLGSFREGAYSHTSISFEQSSNSNFLQLADTVAYNVYRQFVDHGDNWEDAENHTLKMYPHFERISDNFFCHPTSKQVKGFGLVKIPDPNGKRWSKSSKVK